MLIALLTTAFADVPPAPGMTRVPFEITVEGVTDDSDPALVVWPWSLSNGRPTAEVGVVGSGGLEFGRRVMGTPKFWLVPRAQLAEVQTLEEDAAEAWLASNATACEGTIRPRHTVAVLGPSKVVDQYSMKTKPCVLTLEVEGGTGIGAQAGGGTAPGASGMCGCVSGTPPAAAALFALGLLGLRRRG
jgi:MYXO-CTERM domain-containing protein